jgi:hypothetical protein
MTGYDVIGDVHGHADKLDGLLRQLGYVERNGAWRHSGRQAIFVGDLIDRGPEQRRTVDTVRSMIDAGSAQTVLGNHEFNAIGWLTRNPDNLDEHLRRRSDKNRQQHAAFLSQVGEESALHNEYVDWFRTLPIWLDLGDLRVVHACWSSDEINVVGQTLTDELVVKGSCRGSPEYHAIDVLLKGPEIDLRGRTYRDKDGTVRKRARLRWWDATATTLRSAAEIPGEVKARDDFPPLPDDPLEEAVAYAYRDTVPVIFGHYWRTKHSVVDSRKTACVDFSAGRGGPLVAYRWDGGDLTAENFVAFP